MTLRTLAIAAILLAAGLGAFAWWGLEMAAGRRAFDEMDGLIPFFAGVASAVLTLIAALAWWRSR